MIFKHRNYVNENSELEEKIKRDLVDTLQRKGIDISKLHVDLSTGNISISVSLKQKFKRAAY